MSELVGLARLFLKLGVTGFGGPAVHIAMMEREVVDRRAWLTREEFLDLVGATNLIPGPNSTEMAIHIGRLRAGLPGLLVAGLCFVLPAMLIVTALAWLYVAYGMRPEARGLLYGLKPAMLGILAGLVWRLGRTAIKDHRLALVAVAVCVASVWGESEVLALWGGGVVGAIWIKTVADLRRNTMRPALLAIGTGVIGAGASVARAAEIGAATTLPRAIDATLSEVFLFFLKVGAVLYGSGYALIAFLEGGVVREHAWMTKEQLLDAVAVGQFTPGPVFTTSTFVGYVVMHDAGGSPLLGAAVATLGIFLPAFVFVIISGPLIPRLRKSPWMSAFLDAVNASSVALMAAVLIKLGGEILWPVAPRANGPAWAIAVVAAALAIAAKLNPAWIIAGGAAAGWIASVTLL